MPQANPSGGANSERLENVTFPQARIDINDNLEALQTLNSGNSEPSTKAAFMQWLDTSASPAVLKVRNAANSSWVEVGSLSSTLFKSLGVTDIANGGTGETTVASAIAALLPSQSGNSGKVLTTDGSALSWGGSGFSAYAILKHIESSGTSGGSSGTSWTDRILNNEVDPSSIVTLSSNQFTLGAGNYLIKAMACSYDNENTRLRIYNVTDSEESILGGNGFGPTFGSQNAWHPLAGRLSHTTSTTYKLQQISDLARPNTGHGHEQSLGGSENYVILEIYKER
tara:strand:+ start:28 stop:876 length:849 start_codon:yes stop_codon:yes gene_type:complete